MMRLLRLITNAMTILLLGMGSEHLAAQPAVLTPGESETGSFSDALDSEWWQITTTSDGCLTLETVSDSTTDIDIYLYDFLNGSEPVALGTIAGIHETVASVNLMSGTYYAKTLRVNGNGTDTYTISAFFVSAFLENDPEDNDTPFTATSLLYNGNDTGHLGFHSSEKDDINDYWEITVPADGSLNVTTISDSSLEVDLYIIDNDGESIIAGYDISSGIEEATHHDALTPGTYYIKASMYNSTYGSYTITSEFTPTPGLNDSEPNDEVADAADIENLNPLTGHLGHYGDGILDDDDFFSVIVPIEWDTLYVHTISNSTLDVDIMIYGGGGLTKVASGERRGTEEWAERTNLAESIYYIKMHRWSGYGSYSFIVSNSTAARPGDGSTGIADIRSTPDIYRLSVPYPNPFNPSTTIPYMLASDGRVRITVYDILGREVALLVDQVMPAGEHAAVWDARDRYGNIVGNGIYLFRMEVAGYIKTQRAVFIK